VEAGIEIDVTKDTRVYDAICEWFDGLWQKSQRINEQNIKDAQDAWNNRLRGKMTSQAGPSFLDFNVGAFENELPIVVWWCDDDNVELNESSINHLSAEIIEKLRKRNSVEVIGNDRDVLPGRWLLWWHNRKPNKLEKDLKFRWAKIGHDVIENAYRRKKEEDSFSAALEVGGATVPFNFADDTAFDTAFRETINLPDFLALRETKFSAPWFTPRMELMPHFWQALKKRYLELKK
jgi:hypothetical protein